MREALNRVLRDQLQANRDVHLLGQDIEDPKGDVFGVTKGLSTAFPGRVRNAPLSESTIVGTSIGRALTGQRPVAFIQFADFLPLGFNQIISELGSMYWRTDGSWQAPVILMVSCGGYKAGLGPFHAQTLESILAHVPGIDVVMPSSAGDAAGLLNAAFQSKRPTVFLYPKSGLNPLGSPHLGRHGEAVRGARQGAHGAPGQRSDPRHLGQSADPSHCSPPRRCPAPVRRSTSSTCARSRPGTRMLCCARFAAPSACWSCTRTITRPASAPKSWRP